MSNFGHIIVPTFLKMKPERHLHRCPICHQMVEETNAVCQKQLGGTGLDHHTFPCMPHIADWRTRFGIDDLLDVYLGPEQARRFVHEWTDQRVEAREEREATVNPDLRSVKQEPNAAVVSQDAIGIEDYDFDHSTD